MACPFAKRTGPLVFCTAAERKVNPLVFPCFSERYKACRFYPGEEEKPVTEPVIEREETEAEEVEEEERREEALTEEPAAREPATIIEEKGEERTVRRGLGIRIDGKPAENCLECLYYGAQAKACLKLGVDVKDPYKPPCFEVENR